MLIITLSYDAKERTGNWSVMAGNRTQVNLLEVAQALTWAIQDTLARLEQAQIPPEEKDEKA